MSEKQEGWRWRISLYSFGVESSECGEQNNERSAAERRMDDTRSKEVGGALGDE